MIIFRVTKKTSEIRFMAFRLLEQQRLDPTDCNSVSIGVIAKVDVHFRPTNYCTLYLGGRRGQLRLFCRRESARSVSDHPNFHCHLVFRGVAFLIQFDFRMVVAI